MADSLPIRPRRHDASSAQSAAAESMDTTVVIEELQMGNKQLRSTLSAAADELSTVQYDLEQALDQLNLETAQRQSAETQIAQALSCFIIALCCYDSTLLLLFVQLEEERRAAKTRIEELERELAACRQENVQLKLELECLR